MKKKEAIALGAMVVAMLGLAACGKEKAAEESAANEAVVEESVVAEAEDAASEEVSEDASEEANEETTEEVTVEEAADVSEEATEADSTETTDEAALPAYEYPGPELFYTVLYSYLNENIGKLYPEADVTIPCPVIIYEDESDKSDIKVYGDFWVFNYKLNGDILENTSGGSHPGCIHIASTDEGYEVTGMDEVEDGSSYEPSAREIFGDRYDDLIKATSDEKGREELRAQIIANYVFANDLKIIAYKDYGWDPVTLPEQNIDSFYSNLN